MAILVRGESAAGSEQAVRRSSANAYASDAVPFRQEVVDCHLGQRCDEHQSAGARRERRAPARGHANRECDGNQRDENRECDHVQDYRSELHRDLDEHVDRTPDAGRAKRHCGIDGALIETVAKAVVGRRRPCHPSHDDLELDVAAIPDGGVLGIVGLDFAGSEAA